MGISIKWIDIEGSFTNGGVGYKKQRLINATGKIVSQNRMAWIIGLRAYELLLDSYAATSKNTPKISMTAHNDNLQEVVIFVDNIIQSVILNTLKDNGFITDVVTGEHLFGSQIISKPFQQKANILCNLMLLNNLPPQCFPPEYIFYCVIYALDSYANIYEENAQIAQHIPDDVSQPMLRSATEFLGAMQRIGLAVRITKLKAKKAAKAKHDKYSSPNRALIKEWYELNKHNYKTINKAAEDAAFKLDLPFSTARNEISRLKKNK